MKIHNGLLISNWTVLLSHVRMNSDAISDETINISHRLERLYDAIETGKIDLDELAPRIHELRNCQEKLQEINLTLAENRIQFIISR